MTTDYDEETEIVIEEERPTEMSAIRIEGIPAGSEAVILLVTAMINFCTSQNNLKRRE